MPHPPSGPSRRLVLRTNVARLLGAVYGQATPALQARLLTQLLQPVGPLALVAIAAGAFGRLLPRTRWHAAEVNADEAAGFSPEHVADLVRYLEQKCPELLLQLPQMVADPRLWFGSAAGALLLLALQSRGRQAAARGPERRAPGTQD